MTPEEGPHLLAARIPLSETAGTALETHARLLAEWNAKMNLVGPNELSRYWSRHALDSAQLVTLAPQAAAKWLDFGAGAGFPGLVIAALVADRPGARVHLVEKSPKKAEFLKAAVAAMGVPAGVLNARAEDIRVQPYDVITARAFAPLPRLMEHAKPFLAEGAVGLFPKGADHAAELTAAGFQPSGGAYVQGSMRAEALGSLTDPSARVLRIVTSA
jgi:16S rRNA (guanine527-N7)-methyltransferase